MNRNTQMQASCLYNYEEVQSRTVMLKNVVNNEGQVQGHHDKMARSKTHRIAQNTQNIRTQQTFRINYFCVFWIFLIYLISLDMYC